MRRGVPIGPTLLVAVAVPIMLALSWWQGMVRAPWKDAVLAQAAANWDAPPIALPAVLSPDLAFRRVIVTCATLVAEGPAGAATATTGAHGFRYRATCTPTGRDPLPVSFGVSLQPKVSVTVAATTLTGRLIPHGTPPFLLIADTPPPPLLAEHAPGVETITNNHLSYAVQWFGFALTLLIIYGVYVRRWRRGG